MCGRYTLTNADPTVLRARFGVELPARFNERPRFNVAPTDPVLAIRATDGARREAGRLRWGLVPGEWARNGTRPLINARAETLGDQPAFRDSFRRRRCLVPADGFYEWRQTETGKQPVWIRATDGEPFAFAGIWAADGGPDRSALHSCAIVTCEPNELVRPIHDRMPVILDRGAEEAWLSPDAEVGALLELLRPASPEALEVREVSEAVNDVRQDAPHLLDPPLKLF